ncbi:type II inositol 3,4-bisphosphate 4-phosphatase-like [Clupea harengus]|uniref:Type II inositol 3,4-bisphosphate 4-phosphatase-like n=1 Tax=Clupea harengus TaxID=7950 RepID=A0A6P8EWV2_CLUHA|nr:type II inositol 3,4-bisphosphate 4-phosphatase-like [Clupea harengus]XP_031415363.1 type II inositol 3,4-bisphosphate 4-phosphatase-like [Clupea harengus]XP_042559059.1 type II inositol 3,4-bisphosphate 4-phosphatase-like [Clupea harengus]
MAMMETELTEQLWGDSGGAGVIFVSRVQHLELSFACRNLVCVARDRKPNALVQVAALDVCEQNLLAFSSTEIVQGTRDPLFVTGVTFPPQCPILEETVIKVSVYDVKDKSANVVSRLHLGELGNWAINDVPFWVDQYG